MKIIIIIIINDTPLCLSSLRFNGSYRFESHNFFKRTQSSLNTRNGQPFGNSASVPALVCSSTAL